MNRSSLLLLLVPILILSTFTGCSALQAPNSDLGTPGASAVSDGTWRVEARGRFVNEGRTQIQVDLEIQRVGDPSRTIASPSVLTVVGEDAVVEISGNGADLTCSVAVVRKDSQVLATVTTIIAQGGRVVARPMLRFPIGS